MPDNHPTPDSGGETEPKRETSDPQIPCAFGTTQFPPPEPHYSVTCKTEQNWWSKIKPFVEIAGAVILAIYAAYTIGIYCANIKAANAAKEAADTSSDALVKSQRPWLGIDSASIEIDKTKWEIVFNVKNYGPSPALHSSFPSTPAAPQLTLESSKKQIKDACIRGENLTNDPEGHGYTMFPGVPQAQPITIANTPQVPVYLLGCLTYKDEFGKLHHTQFCMVDSGPIKVGDKLTFCFGGQEAD